MTLLQFVIWFGARFQAKAPTPVRATSLADVALMLAQRLGSCPKSRPILAQYII